MPYSVGNLFQLRSIYANGPNVVSFIFSSSPTEQDDFSIIGKITVQYLSGGRASQLDGFLFRIMDVEYIQSAAGPKSFVVIRIDVGSIDFMAFDGQQLIYIEQKNGPLKFGQFYLNIFIRRLQPLEI